MPWSIFRLAALGGGGVRRASARPYNALPPLYSIHLQAHAPFPHLYTMHFYASTPSHLYTTHFQAPRPTAPAEHPLPFPWHAG